MKIEAAKEEYNLDEPLPVRYALWLGGFVTGDFGVQFSEDGQPPVSDLIVERLPRTLSLVIMAQTHGPGDRPAVGTVGPPREQTRRPDKVSTVGAFLLISIPNFALAIIVSYFLAIKLDWFPLVYQADDPLLSRFHQLHAAGADTGPSGGRGVSAPAAHRPDHHAAGGLHPHGAGQGGVATIDPVQTRAAARRCSRSSPCSASRPAR